MSWILLVCAAAFAAIIIFSGAPIRTTARKTRGCGRNLGQLEDLHRPPLRCAYCHCPITDDRPVLLCDDCVEGGIAP